MAAVTRVTVTWIDRYNQTAVIVFHVDGAIVDPTDAIVVAIVAAIEALTPLKAFRIELTIISRTVQTPVDAEYWTCEDKVILPCKDANGTSHTFRVPAPVSAIFDSANMEKLDMSNVINTDLQGDIATYVVGEGGTTMAGFVQGTRTIARKPLKR